MADAELRATLSGHAHHVGALAWSPDGQLLASASPDRSVRIWDTDSWECHRDSLGGGIWSVGALAFDGTGTRLAMGTTGVHGGVSVWEATSGRMLGRFDAPARRLAFAGGAEILVTAGRGQLALWDLITRRKRAHYRDFKRTFSSVALTPDASRVVVSDHAGMLEVFEVVGGSLKSIGRRAGAATDVALGRDAEVIMSAGDDATITWSRLEDDELRLVRAVEGHTAPVRRLALFQDGSLLLSRSADGTCIVWETDTGNPLMVIDGSHLGGPGAEVAMHPSLPRFATPNAHNGDILVWDLTLDAPPTQARSGVSYASAKAVLVGDSGVGKTGLGWRLAHGTFREHASSHGQQFWLLEKLNRTRGDGAQCEIVLWDLAGQPDYRLIHTLFLDDADVALLVFDPTRFDDPLATVEYWLRQFGADEGVGAASARSRFILVAGRSDLGSPRVSSGELKAFCHRWGIERYVITSALRGEGVDELVAAIADVIAWDQLPATVTTDTFRAVKDHVLQLKERAAPADLIVGPDELQLPEDKPPAFEEILSAANHLATHGYVTTLVASGGERRFLLAPELLNNVAASVILEARRDPKELGSLEEESLRAGRHEIRELAGLSTADQELLIDATIESFLNHNVCFRETDPLNRRTFLVFPELMNLKRPAGDGRDSLEEAIWYSATGAVENVYASLVVLMGYTTTFTRTEHWRDHAEYVVGNDLVCGFRVASHAHGVLELALGFRPAVPSSMRTLFQGLFESFLLRPGLVVTRQAVPYCSEGHALSRDVVRKQLADGEDHAFCPRCGNSVALTGTRSVLELGAEPSQDLVAQRATAAQRSLFEQAVFRLVSYVADAEIDAPSCFISYAWGAADNERWVRRLATDLTKAGIAVVLDVWEIARAGSSIPRFLDRVADADKVIVVGTPDYLRKYVNEEPMRGFVLAAEGDLIGHRMTGTESQKASVLPVLLAGSDEESFPPLLRGRVYRDFRTESKYFATTLDLLLDLYMVDPREPVYMRLHEILVGPG